MTSNEDAVGGPPTGVYPRPTTVRDIDNFVELFRALWRQLWFIVLFTVFGVAVTAFFVWRISPTYLAQATVIIQTQATNIIDVTTGLPTSAEEIASQVEILRSRFLAERVVRTLDLGQSALFNGVFEEQSRSSWLADLGLGRLVPSALAKLGFNGNDDGTAGATSDTVAAGIGRDAVGEAARRVIRGLEVGQRGTSRVITVGFRSTDRRVAARIVNTLMDAYIRSQVESKSEATETAVEYLETRLADFRIKVEVAERAVEEYRAETRILEGVNATLLTEEISRLQAESARSRANLAQAEARQALVSDLAGQGETGAIIEVINSPVVQQQKVRETTLLSRVAELETQFGPRHPEAVIVRAELAELRRKMGEEIRLTIQSVETETAGARAQVRALEQEIEKFTFQLDDQNRAGIQLRALEREAAANRDIFERFLERSKRTDQNSIQGADARVISYAEVPTQPVAPAKKLILAVAFVASSLMATGMVLVLELLDKSVRSLQEVGALGLRPLAIVPLISPVRGMTPEESIIRNPSSMFAESIRSLYLNVSVGKTKPKVMLLTSALPGEGKSFLAATLARLVGGRGRKVLLVDCDVRRASVHHYMNARNDQGLVDVLTAETPLVSVIHKDQKSDGVHFVTAGSFVSDSVEIFQSEAMLALFEHLRAQYDLVIMDAPPILPMSDARALAQIADATVLLIRWRKTPQDAVAEAVQELRDVDVNISGAVLNQVDTRKYRRYGYGGFSKAYTGYYAD